MKWKNPLNLIRHKKPDIVFIEKTPQLAVITQSLQVVRPSKGRVVKTKGAPDYHLPSPRNGGRVVRTMPKGLRKLKEHAENADL